MALPVFDGGGSDQELAQLQPGQHATLTGAAAHHAGKVRRLEKDELFDLVDRDGLRLTCRVTDRVQAQSGTGPGEPGAALPFQVVKRFEEPASRPRLGVIQALAKSGRDEQSVEACVELGVDWVMPWAAERCIVQWKGKKAKTGAKKWGSLLEAAAKQSRRSRWPVLLEPHTSAQLKDYIAARRADSLFLVLEADAECGLLEAAQAAQTETSGIRNVYVVVGPEGGIAPGELETLRQAGAKLCRLGTTILRSSSAAPAALAAIAANLGIWEQAWQARELPAAKENDG